MSDGAAFFRTSFNDRDSNLCHFFVYASTKIRPRTAKLFRNIPITSIIVEWLPVNSKKPLFFRLLPIGAICLGGFMAIQTLWLGPWLIHVMGHSPSSAAQIIFWFNSALLLTYIANAILLPKFQKIGLTTLHYISWMVGASIFFQFFAFFLNSSWSYFCWYLYAATSASYVLAHSLVISNFPKSFSGRVSTSFNIAIFIGASLIQWGMGAFVDLGNDIGLSKRDSFNLSFGAYLAIQLAGFVWFLISPKLLSTNQKNQ